MDRNLRRIYFYACFCIFFIVAPILIFHSQGWRFDWRAKKFIHTGSMIIDSYPEKSSIFFDSKQLKQKTPAHIENIYPGKHEIRIQKEGYYPWFKSFDVEAGRSVITEKNVLFRQNTSPSTIHDIPIRTAFWSLSRNAIIYLDEKGDVYFKSLGSLLNTVKLTNIGTISIPSPNQPIIAWDSSEKKAIIAFNGEQRTFLYSIDSESKSTLPMMLIKKSIKKIIWKDSDIFFFIDDQDDLYSFSISTQKEIFVQHSIKDIIMFNGTLYALADSSQGSTSLNKISSETSIVLYSFLQKGNYFFIESNDSVLAVQQSGGPLFLISWQLGTLSLREERMNIQWIHWLSDKTKFLCGNDGEIFLYDYKNFNYQSLLRTSETLHEAFLHPIESAYILAVGNRAESRELDQRDRLNVNILIQNHVSALNTDIDGRYLYYLDVSDRLLKSLQIGE